MINNSKPLQRKTWAEKIANKYQWFKDNGDYLISTSTFGDESGASSRSQKIKALYEIYNSKFPSNWTKHVTDPFSSGRGDNARVWPAKIRPMNILRPNIEFLRGEYPKRPFNFSVVVKGEDGFNSFMEEKKKAVYKNLSQIFINTLNEGAQETGVETGMESKPTDMPEETVTKFIASFKNTLAVQAQIDLDLIMADQRVKEKLIDMFKDWLIAGEVYSFKNVVRDETRYERVDPAELSYDQSPHVKYLKDGDWVVRRMLLTVSDVVDRFYDSLEEKDINKMEDGSYSESPAHFHNWLSGRGNTNERNLVNVYHYTWRSMEKVGFLSYINPISGKQESDIVNEDYPVQKELGETVEWFWRTRWMEGYRIADEAGGLHVEMGPVRFAPSMMNDFAKSTGPYNGRSFSNTHSENISVLKLGLPFQITYIIAGFAMERTLAKSRGKIVLLDQNVIPQGAGWNEDKFFHFSEAQGWALINRNQLGVDKSYNQYQVLDLGLFDHIKNLIDIMDFCKRQYDEQLGISRQSKAQTTSSDSVGGTQSAIYQSSIITEMIFTEFDQFVQTELEGLLDCSQISNINGKRSSYVSDDGRTQILEINPEEYCYSQMGIMLSDSQKDNDALNKMRQYSQAFAQNGATPSTVLAVETAGNVAKLKELLMGVEAAQQKQAQQAAASEEEAEKERLIIQQEFSEFNALLDSQKMHEEYNRKEDLVLIQGDINMALQQALSNPDEASSTEGTEALMKYTNDRDKIDMESTRKNAELQSKVQAQKNKEKRESNMDAHKQKIAEKEFNLKKEIKNKELKIKAMTAKRKPASK